MTDSNPVGLADVIARHRNADLQCLELSVDAVVSATAAQLDERARRIAGSLSAAQPPRTRVLVGLRPGIDFLTAFFGCIYAGMVPVPVTPPAGGRRARGIRAISSACEAGRLIAPEGSAALASDLGLRFDLLPALATGPAQEAVAVTPADIAYLQFTSGSTGTPRGVMISHRAVLANLAAIHARCGAPQSGTLVSWLPFYHDMGLVTSLMALLYGLRLALMEPGQFATQPWSWLETISRYRGVISGAPNFAYDLLLNAKVPPSAEPLDLSNWETAFCGAEPIRASTMRRFARRFAAVGFREAALTPAYGMAEYTLMATSVTSGEGVRFQRVSPGPAGGPEKEFCDLGTPIPGHQLAVVDPQGPTELAGEAVGEVWIAGECMGSGYWGLPEASAATFEARLPGRPEAFLRTGDLGFMRDGHLYLTARSKEMLIVRGRNLHPQDLEQAALSAHPALSGMAAAFHYRQDDAFAILCELCSSRHRQRGTEIVSAIQSELVRRFGVLASTVALARQGTVPRTTNGKVQRLVCAENLRSGALKTLVCWSADEDGELALTAESSGAALDADSIRTFINRFVDARAGIDLALLSDGGSLRDAGLDSIGTVELGFALEDLLGIHLDTALILQLPTVEALASRLATLAAQEPSAFGEPPAAVPQVSLDPG